MTQQQNNIFAEWDSGYSEEQAKLDLANLGAGAYFKFREGDNDLRILPRKGAGPFVEWHRHMIEVPDPEGTVDTKTGLVKQVWRTFKCPKRHGGGRCPACERGEAIVAQATGSYAARQAAKDAAKNYWASMRAQVVVIDRSLGDKAVPQIAELPKGLYEKILLLASDAKKGGVFWSPGPQGYDICINYNNKRAPADMYQPTLYRTPSPLHADPEVSLEWLQTAPDISNPGLALTAEEIEDLLPPLTLHIGASPRGTLPNAAASRALGHDTVRTPTGSAFGRPAAAAAVRTAQDDFSMDDAVDVHF